MFDSAILSAAGAPNDAKAASATKRVLVGLPDLNELGTVAPPGAIVVLNAPFRIAASGGAIEDKPLEYAPIRNW